MTTLADLQVMAQATVLAVDGQDEISLRLLEMGLTPGTPVTRIGTAPLGDPLEFEIRGYRLSLRKTEAARVAIEMT
jgi:ferrous iron transport protein A|tara:strand:+ start:299 stop:526 length:228 start_codon:yes stop_codon:yes gene_type:complete